MKVEVYYDELMSECTYHVGTVANVEAAKALILDDAARNERLVSHYRWRSVGTWKSLGPKAADRMRKLLDEERLARSRPKEPSRDELRDRMAGGPGGWMPGYDDYPIGNTD